jgi:hypothetical protein
MLHLRRCLAANGFAVLGACGGKTTTATAPRPELVGSYSFDQQVTNPGRDYAPRSLQGVVHVLGDTVIVESQVCRPDNANSTPGSAFRYKCVDYDLYFDRENPVSKAAYSVHAIVIENKSVCSRTAIDAQGKEYCAQRGVEPVERSVTLNGKLKLQHIGLGSK